MPKLWEGKSDMGESRLTVGDYYKENYKVWPTLFENRPPLISLSAYTESGHSISVYFNKELALQLAQTLMIWVEEERNAKQGTD